MSPSKQPSFMNRDARQMIRYGQEAKAIVDNMNFRLRMIEGLLDACRPRLDDNTNKRIDELHECCGTFRREIVAYRQVAETIEEKGKKLLNAQEGRG